jgi:hypothetical protein
MSGPSTTKIEIQNEREGEVWRDGHKQGWDDAILEVTRQEKLVKPNLCARVAAMFRRRLRSHDAGWT